MGKVLALDFGLKRTGCALSDENKTFAFPLETVDSRGLMDFLKQIIQKEKISDIVLGEPKRLNNEDSHITQNVYLLKEALEKSFPALKIVLMDERFTSKMAYESLTQSGHNKAVKNNKGLIDQVSATIILQSYLQSLG